jgi:hypothetical protein
MSTSNLANWELSLKPVTERRKHFLAFLGGSLLCWLISFASSTLRSGVTWGSYCGIYNDFRGAPEPQGVPSFERLLDRARALTAASVNWEPGKTVGGVQTFSLKPLQGKGPRWWARVSEHGPRHGKSAFDLVCPS